MLESSPSRLLHMTLLTLPLMLSACSGGTPSQGEMAQLEADLLSQPSGFNMLFGGNRRQARVDVEAIKIVKQSCEALKNFDSAFDCTVSFTLNDEPHENTLRVIHHEDGKWSLAHEQPAPAL